MVNITNKKSCPYISPPMYKPTKKCLRTNISPGLTRFKRRLFSCAKPNVNEQDPLFELICIRLDAREEAKSNV